MPKQAHSPWNRLEENLKIIRPTIFIRPFWASQGYTNGTPNLTAHYSFKQIQNVWAQSFNVYFLKSYLTENLVCGLLLICKMGTGIHGKLTLLMRLYRNLVNKDSPLLILPTGRLTKRGVPDTKM